MKKFFLVMFVAFALPAWAGGDSSDGHTHGEPTPTPASAPISQGAMPRAATATEEFEVVAALEGQNLVVYVDRFASNEPVTQAKVEIEGAGLKGIASETTPGTYVLDVPSFLPPARHALTISIESAEDADLLAVTLDTSASVAVAHVVHTHSRSEWIIWALAAALLLVTGILIAVQRRQGARRKM